MFSLDILSHRDVTPTTQSWNNRSVGRRFAMVYGVFKALIEILCICVISSGTFLRAECSIDTIIVNGQVEHAPRKGIVKVQLIYPKDKIGESGDVTVEDGSFASRFCSSHRAVHHPEGSIPPEKCARKPKTIVVSLIANDQEYDRVSLDMAKDFKKIEPSTYALRSEILLQGRGDNPDAVGQRIETGHFPASGDLHQPRFECNGDITTASLPGLRPIPKPIQINLE